MKKFYILFFISFFTAFSAVVKAGEVFDMVVAKDGSGDYTTLTSAINSATDNGTVIFIKNGVYREKVDIRKKNITLIGQSAEGVVFVWNGSAAADGTSESYTVRANGENFYAENITFSNDYGTGSQAVALSVRADKSVFKNCRFLSFQDTHYIHSNSARQYYKDCFIEGGTDFIFGGAIAVFDDCQINCMKGGSYITAPANNTYDYGMVFRDCIITANGDVPANNGYLGRPWKADGKTVWLNCKIGSHIRPEGWARWRTDPNDDDYLNAEKGFYAEYKSTDLAGNLLDVSYRSSWSKQLTEEQAAEYTLDNIYGNKRTSTWDPLPAIEAPARVEDMIGEANEFSWTAVAGAKGYVIVRNGNVIGISTEASFTDETAEEDTGYTYYIYTVGSKGNLSERSNSVLINGGGDETGEDPYPGFNDGETLIDENFTSQSWIDNEAVDALASSVFVPASILGVYREIEITQNSKILPDRDVPEDAPDASRGAVYLEKLDRGSYFILPELPSCKNITAVWCLPNNTDPRTLILEKNVYGSWVKITEATSDLTLRQGILSYDVNEPDPVQFRLYNGSANGGIYLHDLKITAFKDDGNGDDDDNDGVGILLGKIPSDYLCSNIVNNNLYLNNTENISSLTIYSLSGKKVVSVVNPGNNIDVSGLNKGYYIISITLNSGEFDKYKIVKY